ncbi:MAG: hypothetical protein ACLRMZ_21630 [Blautia marasmi]
MRPGWIRQIRSVLSKMQQFNDLMMMYRCAIREVQTVKVLDDEFSVEYKRNPIFLLRHG